MDELSLLILLSKEKVTQQKPQFGYFLSDENLRRLRVSACVPVSGCGVRATT